eukprot:scaffold42532_cov35-Attheya_sp.AAC.3
MVNIGCNKPAWLNLTVKVQEADCCLVGRTVPISKAQRWTHPRLSVVLKVQEKRDGELLGFETEKYLECLCGIFGETTTVNVRAIPPALPKDGSHCVSDLEVGDAINIIGGSEEREELFNSRTQCDSVDFVFDGL